MRFRRFAEHWQGIFLMLIGCVAAVWLGVTKQLKLYIHPRYIGFTIIMAVLGLLLALASFRYVQQKDRHEVTRLQLGISSAVVIVCLLAAINLLAIKPTTLTTSTANQRGINSGMGAGIQTNNAVPLFGGGDYTSFGVQDWAGLLVQTNDPSFYADKTANIIGFVSPDKDDSQNVFFVSRFVITCCAVDARPIGVPVFAPNWQATYKPDSWVQTEGSFIANPSAKSQQRVVIKPSKVTSVEQPKDPYVH